MSFFAAPRVTLRWRKILGIVSVPQPPLWCEEVPWKDKFATLMAFSSKAKEDAPDTVGYLIDTLGFSPESAKKAAKYLNFKTLETPNCVLEFFKSHGFSHSQVLSVVRVCPKFLTLHPEKTLLPKLEFFYSTGASSTEVAELVRKCPTVFTRSLAGSLVPSFNYYVGLFGSKEKIFHIMKQFGSIRRFDSGGSMACNVRILKDCGVTVSGIPLLCRKKPFALNSNPDTFRSVVERIGEMGLDPRTSAFVKAITALGSNSESTWKRKLEIYRQWGWSDEDFLRTFRQHPSCMQTSDEKIASIMNLVVKELDFEPSAVARYPFTLGFSFRKRIRPRAAVVQALVSRGFLEKKFSLMTVFKPAEGEFLEKFVHTYEDQVPDLPDLYRRKLDGSGEP